MKPFVQHHSIAFCHNHHIGQSSVCTRSSGSGSFNLPVPNHRFGHFDMSQRLRRLQHLKLSSSSDFDSSKNNKNEVNANNKDEIEKKMESNDDIDDMFRIEQQKHLHNDDDFLNFDDEDFLEELIQFSNPDDLDVAVINDCEPGLMDFDNEMKELEKFIDERTYMNSTGDGFIDFEDDVMNIGVGSMNEGDLGGVMKEGTLGVPAQPTPTEQPLDNASISTPTTSSSALSSALEEALLQGVVPAAAGVGSNCLPGDYGFDPLGFSTKDYFKQVQIFFLNLLPSSGDKNNAQNEEINNGGAALPLSTKPTPTMRLYDNSRRPPALILRDYREAEIRHGRLAMLAALLWPLQEIIDRLFIPESFGQTTFVYGGPTLPFVSLFMTFVMLLLGYLDIYAASIKDVESGDAFLPGECFWDPLSILAGAPDPMKRRMQERELNNGRMAMIAVLSYILQEGITHEPVINLPWNQALFEPAFEIPAVQAWLDLKFAGASSSGNSILETVTVDDLDLMINQIYVSSEIITSI